MDKSFDISDARTSNLGGGNQIQNRQDRLKTGLQNISANYSNLNFYKTDVLDMAGEGPQINVTINN